MSSQEAFELEYIEKCVQFKDGKFHVQFPFLVDPKELADNYHQVVRIAQAEERKLEREDKMKEFNPILAGTFFPARVRGGVETTPPTGNLV